MHARIGAPGTGHRDRMISHEGKRFLDYTLHGWAVRQALPAVEIRTVVFNAERDAQASLRHVS